MAAGKMRTSAEQTRPVGGKTRISAEQTRLADGKLRTPAEQTRPVGGKSDTIAVGADRKEWLRPGYLTVEVKADGRRGEFDIKNQVLIQNKVPVDLLFIGDSITQMWELPAYFHGSGLLMVNRGIGGDRTEYLLHRFRADAIQLKPALCVLLVGINDSWELEFDHWKQEPGQPPERVLARALDHMAQVLELAAREHMNLAVCSILPTCMAWTNHEEARKEYVRQYNAGLRILAGKYGHLWVDYYPAFTGPDGRTLRRELSVEGLHPNVFGYNVMAGILAAALREQGIALGADRFVW